MELDAMSRMFDVAILALLLGSGGYALMTFFRLNKEWRIFNNVFLLPSECPPQDCKDVDSYLEYIRPKILLVGIVCIICGILYIPVVLPNLAQIMGLSDTASQILALATPALGFVALVIYIVGQTKAAKRFWK